MLSGLRKASEENDADMVLANPILPDDVLKGNSKPISGGSLIVLPSKHTNWTPDPISIHRSRSGQYTYRRPLFEFHEAIDWIHQNSTEGAACGPRNASPIPQRHSTKSVHRKETTKILRWTFSIVDANTWNYWHDWLWRLGCGEYTFAVEIISNEFHFLQNNVFASTFRFHISQR